MVLQQGVGYGIGGNMYGERFEVKTIRYFHPFQIICLHIRGNAFRRWLREQLNKSHLLPQMVANRVLPRGSVRRNHPLQYFAA